MTTQPGCNTGSSFIGLVDGSCTITSCMPFGSVCRDGNRNKCLSTTRDQIGLLTCVPFSRQEYSC